MATQKQIKSRIQLKHDSKANWDKATTFVPLAGELIVYDDLKKIKVGDGSTTVGNLTFVGDDAYWPLAGGSRVFRPLELYSNSIGGLGRMIFSPYSYDNMEKTEWPQFIVRGKESVLNGGTTVIDPLGITIRDYEAAETYLQLNRSGLQINDGKVNLSTTALSITDPDVNQSTTLSSTSLFISDYGDMTDVQITGAGISFGYDNSWTRGTLTGITDTIGTSSTLAASQKLVKDTAAKYLPLAGGTLTGNLHLGISRLDFGTGAQGAASAEISAGYLSINNDSGNGDGVFYQNDIFTVRLSRSYFRVDGSTNSIKIQCDGNDYSFKSDGIYFGEGPENNGVISGITDSLGTSSTLAASQKCVKSALDSLNYLSRSGGTISGTNSETGTLGSTLLDPGTIEVFSEGLGQITVYKLDSNAMRISSSLTPDYLAISDNNAYYMNLSKASLSLNYGGGTNSAVINSKKIQMDAEGYNPGLTMTASGLTFANTAGQLTGISDTTGTSSTVAISQKGLSTALANYVQSTDSGLNTLINKLGIGSDTPHNDDYFISQFAGGGTTTTTYHRRKISTIRDYLFTQLTAGNGISITRDSSTGKITISCSYSQYSGSATQLS